MVYLTVPIGNREDITLRVLEALRIGKYFAVEDSRRFLDLLGLYDIPVGDKVFITWFEHSAKSVVEKIAKIVDSGEILYVVSEAGSPIISDPGYDLVMQYLEHTSLTSADHGLVVDSYSGISSLTVGLELSLFPPHPFHFYGFISKKESDLVRVGDGVKSKQGGHFYFISPHQLLHTLDFLTQILPDHPFYLGRELTKFYQENLRFMGKEWEKIKVSLVVKGEFVLGIYQEKNEVIDEGKNQKIKELAEIVLAEKGKKKEVSKLLALILSGDASEYYKILM